MPHAARRLLVAALPVALLAGSAARHAAPPGVAEAVPNDNRVAAGRRVGDTLRLDLVAVRAAWRPDLGVDSSVTVQAFAEDRRGGPGAPRIPGPLLRAATGTAVRVRVRNALPDSVLVVHGLRAGTITDDTVQVAPGATRELRFRLGVPGTYLYWGTTTGARGPRFATHRRDSQLAGAIVVDPAGTRPDPRERTFVMTVIDIVPDTAKGQREDIWELAINGRSWPHSERLRYTVGDTVRWRWVNATYLPHPMHLHGFHFRTLARGNGRADTTYAPGEIRDVVTEFMAPGATFRMSWVPTRAGQWLMHCHMAAHMVPFPERPDSVQAHDAHDVASHPRNAMAGLVLGVTTEERVGRGARGGRGARVASDVAPPPAPPAARRLRLFVQERAPDSAGRPPRRGYVLQQGDAPAADSVVSPGTPLVLVRGERTAITVVNRLREPTTVHWHGMELESFFDGVAGWSGARTSLAPLVAPGDSFAVAFTPPRAGTFIYHTHMDEGSQLRTGLYGPMLVLEPGERMDPATDHVLMVGGVVAGRRSVPGVNGRAEPAPLELRAGVTHRLRLVNIMPTIPVRAELRLARLGDTTLVAWRPLSKDGALLPAALRRDAPARQSIGVGETFDFTWTPARPMTAMLTFVLPEEERPNLLRVPVRVVP